MYDAFQTAECVISDIHDRIGQNPSNGTSTVQDILDLLRKRGSNPLSFNEWKIIEAEEKRRGAECGKPIEKLTSIDEVLSLIQNYQKK